MSDLVFFHGMEKLFFNVGVKVVFFSKYEFALIAFNFFYSM